MAVPSLASDFISLCSCVSTHERRVLTQHISYRIYEGLTDPVMSTLHPRPLLFLLFTSVPVWSLRRHSVDRENSGTGGQLGSLASVSPLTQGGRGELLCVWGSLAGNACGRKQASQKSSPAQPALAPHAYKWAGFPPQAAAPSFVFSVFSHQAWPQKHLQPPQQARTC